MFRSYLLFSNCLFVVTVVLCALIIVFFISTAVWRFGTPLLILVVIFQDYAIINYNKGAGIQVGRIAGETVDIPGQVEFPGGSGVIPRMWYLILVCLKSFERFIWERAGFLGILIIFLFVFGWLWTFFADFVAFWLISRIWWQLFCFSGETAVTFVFPTGQCFVFQLCEFFFSLCELSWLFFFSKRMIAFSKTRTLASSVVFYLLLLSACWVCFCVFFSYF